MKNLLIYINPRKDFDEEGKIAIKIQIDNSLDLGWKKEDIILATNFPYVYNGIKSIILNDDVYVDWFPQSTKMSAIVNLFERGLIDEDALYWVHDIDAYQMEVITQSELDLGKADMALTDRGLKIKWYMCTYFFKGSAQDILRRLKEIMYKYQVDEESALMALTTNNPLWITGAETTAEERSIPLDIPGIENLHKRVKKLNISYNFWPDDLNQTYEIVVKPIKVLHFHFSFDILLDSAMYGKNFLKKPLMPERLIKIFHKHGVRGIFPKPMKNLMIYINPEKRFLDNAEYLVKKQIDNSLKLGWKKEDIILLTNFAFEYEGVKAVVVDESLFSNINYKAIKSNAIFQLLTQGAVKEAEIWWYHDLDVFQIRKVESTEIDLEDTLAGFMNDSSGKLDTGSIFFRKESDKIFEWIRNRTIRLKADEATALASLAAENYRNINFKYIKLNPKPTLAGYLKPKQLDALDAQFVPERLVKIFHQHGIS